MHHHSSSSWLIQKHHGPLILREAHLGSCLKLTITVTVIFRPYMSHSTSVWNVWQSLEGKSWWQSHSAKQHWFVNPWPKWQLWRGWQPHSLVRWWYPIAPGVGTSSACAFCSWHYTWCRRTGRIIMLQVIHCTRSAKHWIRYASAAVIEVGVRCNTQKLGLQLWCNIIRKEYTEGLSLALSLCTYTIYTLKYLSWTSGW